MKKTESRSGKNKSVAAMLVILLILVGIIGETVISYHWIKVNSYPVTVKDTTGTDVITDAGLRIVVIADLHDHEFGSGNERLIRDIEKEKPQMIILDGDILNEDSKSDQVPVTLVKNLAEIAPVYYALGNHELAYIGSTEGDEMQGHPLNSELVRDLTAAGACIVAQLSRQKSKIFIMN